MKIQHKIFQKCEKVYISLSRLTIFQCLMVQKDGNLYLKDIPTGVKVCQLALPNTHQIMSPWEPVVAFGGRGQLLFVKGLVLFFF